MSLFNRLRTNSIRYAFVLSAAVYLLFSVGIVKSTHFCMGREASVAYFSADAKKCPCSLYSTEKSSCCDDKSAIIKIEDDQKSIEAYTIRLPQLYILEDLYTERFITSLIDARPFQTEREQDNAPPPVPLFKAHCSLVFYDDESSLG